MALQELPYPLPPGKGTQEFPFPGREPAVPDAAGEQGGRMPPPLPTPAEKDPDNCGQHQRAARTRKTADSNGLVSLSMLLYRKLCARIIMRHLLCNSIRHIARNGRLPQPEMMYTMKRGYEKGGSRDQAELAFIKILLIELDDLDQDIELLIREYEEKHNKAEISEYVFHENLALMKREFFGVKGFRHTLKTLAAEQYATLNDLHQAVDQLLQETIREKGLPNSILLLVRRKMEKVLRYIERGSF
jgi:hypothetical protein